MTSDEIAELHAWLIIKDEVAFSTFIGLLGKATQEELLAAYLTEKKEVLLARQTKLTNEATKVATELSDINSKL